VLQTNQPIYTLGEEVVYNIVGECSGDVTTYFNDTEIDGTGCTGNSTYTWTTIDQNFIDNYGYGVYEVFVNGVSQGEFSIYGGGTYPVGSVLSASNGIGTIVNGLTTYGDSVLIIIGLVLAFGIGYLVYVYGVSAIKNSLNGGMFMDSMGTYHRSRKERDEMNETIDKMGW